MKENKLKWFWFVWWMKWIDWRNGLLLALHQSPSWLKGRDVGYVFPSPTNSSINLTSFTLLLSLISSSLQESKKAKRDEVKSINFVDWWSGVRSRQRSCKQLITHNSIQLTSLSPFNQINLYFWLIWWRRKEEKVAEEKKNQTHPQQFHSSPSQREKNWSCWGAYRADETAWGTAQQSKQHSQFIQQFFSLIAFLNCSFALPSLIMNWRAVSLFLLLRSMGRTAAHNPQQTQQSARPLQRFVEFSSFIQSPLAAAKATQSHSSIILFILKEKNEWERVDLRRR